jgi:hypothetical protein
MIGAPCWVVVLLTVFGSRFPYVFCGACGVRDSRFFEDVEVMVGALCRNVFNMLYLWVSAHSPGSMSFANFLLSCSFLSSVQGLFCILHVY